MSLLRPSSRIDTSATPTPFTELMALQALPPGGTGTTSGRFVSLTTPFVPMDIPGNEAPRTFGGHVYAQAILAAAQTVTPGQTLCNITGNFISPGNATIPFYYTVSSVTSGSRYSTCSVTVHQYPEEAPGYVEEQALLASGSRTPCFTASLIFKSPEPTPPSTFEPLPSLLQEYASVLCRPGSPSARLSPESHPHAPAVDIPSFRRFRGESMPECPGVEFRHVDMKSYNQDRGPGGYRQLQFYRVVGPEILPDVSAANKTISRLIDPNTAAAMHAYASDRNGLFIITRALGRADAVKTVATLTHTVIFHGGSVQQLGLYDPVTRRRRWFVQESWTVGSNEGRGTFESRLWCWADGEGDAALLVAATMQDGVIRLFEEGKKPTKARQDDERQTGSDEGVDFENKAKL